MNKSSSILRKPELDALRIAAGLMVVAIHTYAPILNEGYQLTFRWWEANVINSFSRWAVPVFVMLSGYLVLGAQQYIFRKRVIRLAIPLCFWSAVYLLIDHFFHQPLSLGDVREKLFSGTPHYHLYFLYVMVGLAVFTPLIRMFLTRSRIQHHIVLFIVFYALALTHKYTAEPNGLTIFIRFLPFYLLGYLMRDMKIAKPILAVGFIVCCLSSALLQQYGYLQPLTLLGGLCAFLFALQCHLKNEPRYLRPLSEATLGIYLIHPLFLPYFYGEMPPMLAWLATFAVSALAALLLMKIPLIRKIIA